MVLVYEIFSHRFLSLFFQLLLSPYDELYDKNEAITKLKADGHSLKDLKI